MLRFPVQSKTLIFQNAFAALLFAFALSGNVFAYLLHLLPSSEVLWRISVPVNRAVQPITWAVDSISVHPGFSLALMLLIVGIPYLAFRSRSWIGTAVVSHTALGACVLMMLNVADTRLRQSVTADNLLHINPDYLNSRVIGFGTVAAVMLVFCAMNHVAFFRIKASMR